MKHGTVRVVHYDEISAGGSVSGRETDPSALSCPYTGTDDGHEREILWQRRIAERQQEIWRCALYLRLSREDEGTAIESNSIRNQRVLLMDYIAARPELCFTGEWVDDGYSGSSFERPALQRMLQAARDGKVDCILVKDLISFRTRVYTDRMVFEKVVPAVGDTFYCGGGPLR